MTDRRAADRRASAPVRAFWLGVLVLCATVVALMLARTGSEPASAAAEAAPCAETELPPSGERVTCSTGATRLTIAGERRPLVLEGTEVRVLRSRLRGRTLTVTLRLRNRAQLDSRIPFARGQLYVNAGGRVFREPRTVGDGSVPGREAVRVRFRLDRATAERVVEGTARADLGVVPWAHVGRRRPAAVGVVRLTPDLG